MLSRRVGVQHIEAVEDAVQSALMAALESWARAAVPDNPSAWLFRVAHNELLGEASGVGANFRNLPCAPSGNLVQNVDALGRAFLTLVDDGTRTLATRVTLDVEGQTRRVTDARGNDARSAPTRSTTRRRSPSTARRSTSRSRCRVCSISADYRQSTRQAAPDRKHVRRTKRASHTIGGRRLEICLSTTEDK